MAVPWFRSFVSTVTPFLRAEARTFKFLVDPITGAPAGVANWNDNGADGIWTPVDVTAAQVTTPSRAMIADLNATYRLNVAPYTRYRSDGTELIGIDGSNVQGPNGLFGNMVVYAPFTITDPDGISIRGTIHVINFAA